jgi:hypothetical protein
MSPRSIYTASRSSYAHYSHGNVDPIDGPDELQDRDRLVGRVAGHFGIMEVQKLGHVGLVAVRRVDDLQVNVLVVFNPDGLLYRARLAAVS